MFDSMQLNADENTKYNFAYLIDVSDSVEKNTLQQLKDAYTSLTKSLIDGGIAGVSQFAVIPFSSDAILNAPLNATEAISTIEGLSEDGFTNFNAALEKANQFFSTVPPGATNIAYFLSDGFSTTGGSFKESAKALQAVADVRAYGFGAANIQSLEIVDSNQPVIVSEASELKTEFINSINNLVASNSQIDSTTDDNNDVEIASPPVNEPVEDESDTSNDQIKKDESNLVDDSIPQNLVKPEVDDIIKLGSNIDALPDTESPILKVEDISIEEGDIGSSIAQFTVNLSSPATKEIQFSYQTVDGSAISTSDYDPISGQITIPVGETSTNIDVEVNGDNEVELNEEFTLNLFGLSGATFENNKAEYSKVATIENDDIAQVTESTQVPDDGSIFDGNLLDLKSFAGDVTVAFTVDREAEFDNTVSFYKIEDTEGTITDPVTGNRLKPSDGEAYAELAIELKESQIELSVDNLNSITIQDTLDGGYLYAPFIVADGNLDDGFSQVYFSFAQANSDKFEHIRSLGNTLTFEDLANGGDRDFNDMVISAEITI